MTERIEHHREYMKTYPAQREERLRRPPDIVYGGGLTTYHDGYKVGDQTGHWPSKVKLDPGPKRE